MISPNALRSLATLAKQFNSEDGMATYATVVLNVDPFSNEGTDWLIDARRKIDELAGEGATEGFDVYLVDGAGVPYDMVKEVYDVFPLLIGEATGASFLKADNL